MKHRSKQRVSPATRGAGALTALRAALRIDNFSFRDQVVLITGGSRGLGLVLARRLARAGARLAIVARDQAELTRARVDLRQHGAEVLALRCDVRDPEEVKKAIDQITSELGPVDVLINNAGEIEVGPLDVMTPEDYRTAMQTHFWGPLQTTLAVLPGMRERRHGRIVNVSSLGGKLAVPHLLPYSASKFALTGLSEGMRAELLQHGVVVTAVCPGLMRTGSPLNAFFKGQHRKEYTWFTILDSLPLISMSAETAARRILRAVRRGKPEVTLSLQAYLASRLHGLLPGVVTDVMGLMNRLLPAPNGIGTQRARGKDSQSRLSTSFLTFLTRRAAQKYNQMP